MLHVISKKDMLEQSKCWLSLLYSIYQVFCLLGVI